MSHFPMQQSKTKRFFKRIERFIVSCKQYVIVRHLLFSGGKEVIANYKHFSLETVNRLQMCLLFGFVGGKAGILCRIL